MERRCPGDSQVRAVLAMSWWPELVGAGVVAGMSGTITGVGSVFSYPVLLAAGLPATSANVTNTVSLALGGVGGAYSSRPETAGRSWLTLHLCVAAALGTVVGSALLLASPPGVFEATVPFLVAVASLSILLPRPRRAARGSARAALLGMAAVSVYNGYFAAGSAVLMVAAMLATTALTLTTINGIKNVVVLVSDLTAAVAFAIFGPVDWASVPPLAAGLLVGTWLGPPIARRLPVGALRVVIALAGLALAVGLGVATF